MHGDARCLAVSGTPLASNPDLMEHSWSAVYVPGSALLTLPGAGVPSGGGGGAVPPPSLETLQVGTDAAQVCPNILYRASCIECV